MVKRIEFHNGASAIKKNILYIIAGLVTVLSIVLEILWTGRFGGYDLFPGLSGIISLLMFRAAWEIGQNPGKPLYQAMLFSLGGLLSPLIAQLLSLEIDVLDLGAVAELLLFLSPVIPAYLIGSHTRKGNFTTAIRTLLNSLPGFLMTVVCVCLMLRDSLEPNWILRNIPPAVFLSLVTLLSAYSEAQIDPTERRKVQWNCWRLFILLEILIGVKNVFGFLFDYYCHIVFLTLLQITFPLILWQWKKRLSVKEYSRNYRTAFYFTGAFLLTVLQSGGLRYLMELDNYILSEEWMLIGTVVSLAVYWQKPRETTTAGFIWSVLLIFVNAGSLFMTNKRLREVFYDLCGPAINIELSSRADWLGYRILTFNATLSGDYDSLYNLYEHATHSQGFMNVVTKTTSCYVFPVTIAIFILTITATVFLVKLAKNRNAAKAVGISMVLRSVIAFIESAGLFPDPIGFAFTGYYISEYVLLSWMLRSGAANVIKQLGTKTETETTSAAIVPEHKRIKTITAILLSIALFTVFKTQL